MAGAARLIGGGITMFKAILASIGLMVFALICGLMVAPHVPAILSGLEIPRIRLILAGLGVVVFPAVMVSAWVTGIRNNRSRLATEDHLRAANPGSIVFSARATPEFIASLNALRLRTGLPAVPGGRVPLGIVVAPSAISVWKSTGELVISLPVQQVASIQATTIRTRIPGLRRTMPLECLQLDVFWAGQVARLFIPITVRAMGYATRADVAAVTQRVIASLAVRV